MDCPSCGYLLQKLSVTTKGGGKFDVDHCGYCGGTWFDPYEINRIPHHEVIRLARHCVLPKRIPPLPSSHYCPRCRKKLEHFMGESVPKGVELLRCPKDQGIWATQKALEKFKSFQDKTITKYKTGESAFPPLSVVFIPALFILLLFVSTFVTVTHLQEAKEGRIKAAAQISQLKVTPLSPYSISITFQTKEALQSSISYGPSTLEFVTRNISMKLTTSHGILITNLKPDTVYIYRITLTDGEGRDITSEEDSFITGR